MLQIDNLEAKSGSFIFLRCIFKQKCFSFWAPRPQFEDISDTAGINVPGLSVCNAVYTAWGGIFRSDLDSWCDVMTLVFQGSLWQTFGWSGARGHRAAHKTVRPGAREFFSKQGLSENVAHKIKHQHKNECWRHTALQNSSWLGT